MFLKLEKINQNNIVDSVTVMVGSIMRGRQFLREINVDSLGIIISKNNPSYFRTKLVGRL